VRQLLTSPKFITLSIAIVALIILPLTLIEVQNSQTFEQHASGGCPGFDGDSNSVIWCGADSGGTARPSRITTAYNKGDGHNSAKSIQNIYGSAFFHISNSDIQHLSTIAKVGSVTKSGDVMLNGKVVATNAFTAGRTKLTSSCGSSTRHQVGDTVFWTRKPCVSFNSNSIGAYIVMSNNKFKFAILISCGNPVIGTPKSSPTPTPTKKPTPTPTKGPTPTPTKKPTPTSTPIPTPRPTTPPGQPTPTICPTLAPVKNVHITCPNCQLSPSPSTSPSP